MAAKNQERCLNSQPFSRQRAYLNRQKCQKSIIKMKELEPEGEPVQKINRSHRLTTERVLADAK